MQRRNNADKQDLNDTPDSRTLTVLLSE